ILAVDDDEDARDLIDSMLTEPGAEVVRAASVADAMSSLARHEPDVILTDLCMPGEDGYDLLRQVRGRDRGKGQTPIAALSASTTRTPRPPAEDDRSAPTRAGRRRSIAEADWAGRVGGGDPRPGWSTLRSSWSGDPCVGLVCTQPNV